MSTDAFEYKSGSMSSVAQGRSGSLNLDEAQGIVECFVAGIGNKDSVGDIVHSGAFTKSLMRRKPRVVWGHNWNDPIGKVLEIYEVPNTDPRLPLKMKMAGIGGLFARVQFNLQSEKGKEAFANVAFFGEEQEWSIGYKTLKAQFDQKVQANIIYELELYEVSPVLHGANQLTGTISVKAGMPAAPDMEQMPAGPVQVMPQRPSMQQEIEQELQKMLGGPVAVTEVDEENGMVSFNKPGADNGMDKYKCQFSRGNGGGLMFGAPERIVVIAKPPMATSPGMPMVEPQRVVRPSQMPSIPVAIKPGPTGGMTVVPLPPVQYEGQEQKPVDKNSLDQEESDLRDALLKIVKRHGKINEDADGIWAGYKPALQNPVAGIGVKCSNCVFYNKDNSCQIVDMPIEPEGKCRFAIIPPGVVQGDFNMKKQYEFETEEEEDDYVSEFEFKYPGELLIAALRGAVGKKRRKKRKFKHLAEFGTYEDEMDPGKPYYLPVSPDVAFHVKQALDPIFDYHRAETYVDVEGIVITDGVSYELIDAIDTALDNLKKKDLIPDGLQVKVSGYRLGRAIGSRLVDRPNLGGGRSARRFFTTPGAERFDPRTAVDRNLNGVVGEGIFLRGTPLEQPDPTPDGPGSINNPTMPGDKAPVIKPPRTGVDAAPETPYVREPARPKKPSPDDYRRGPAKPEDNTPDKIELLSSRDGESDYVRGPAPVKKPSPDDYRREPAKVKPSTRDDIQLMSGLSKMPKEMQAAQAKSKDYANYLRTREADRSIEDRIRFEGPYSVMTRDGKLSSGADSLDKLKPGDVIDTGTAEGRAIVEQYYAKMGDQIVALLEEAVKNPGKFKWNMPWRGGEHIPRNPTKKNRAQKAWAYQGSNYLMLNAIAVERGYPTNKWAGISQWKQMRGKAKKNAMPVGVLTPILGSQPRQYKYEFVYNVADIEGLPPKMYEPDIDLENMSPKARVKNAEDIVSELAPRIRESNVGGAYYSPSGDYINMPEFKTFENAEGYYATLLHEMTHWTGHSSRNARKHGRWKTPAYAFEELIAEIGASLLLGMVGISPRIREDHIGYLKGWLESIKSDPNALRRAMTQAQQAVDFMLNRSKTLRRLSGMEDGDRKAKTSVVDSVPLPMLEGYEGAPNIPVGSPITGGPASDLDERELVDDIADQLSSGGIAYENRKYDVTDMSDLRTNEDRRKYGSYTTEERMLAGLEPIFVTDRDGRAMTMDGSFSSGGTTIAPRQGSKAQPVKQTPATTDMAGLLGLVVPPTQEQRDIIDLGVAAAFGKEKIVVGVDAAAGSGKTTTMKMVATAIGAEFDTDDIFERFAGDDVSRRQQLVKKAQYLIDKYGEEADGIKKLLPAKADALTGKKERAIANAIAALGAKYGVTPTNKPNIYYTVFGREARIDAVDAFPPNTGIGTTTQLAYWALRLGVAERKTPQSKIINGEGIARKIEISTEFAVPQSLPPLRNIAGADRVQETLGYDPKLRRHDSVQVSTQGKTASFKDLGYIMLEDSEAFRTLLERAGKPLKTTTRQRTVGKGQKRKTITEEIVTLPFQVDIGDGITTQLTNQILASDLMEWLAVAFRRWSLSTDTSATKNVFTLTPRERDDTNKDRPRWVKKKRKKSTQALDEQLDLKSIPPDWLKEMIGYVQLGIDELLDGNGYVLPTQDQLPKLLLMADPDLSTSPGAVGHGTRDYLKGVRMPPAFGVQPRDIVYVSPTNNLPYETQTDGRGRVEPIRLWTKDEGEPFVVVGIKQGQSKLKKIYASEEKPLSLFAIDEAQDLNDIWEELLKRNRDRVSVMTVGDDRQQIMGFAGSKNIMQATNPDFAPKLTQSFRFPSLIGYLGTLILGRENNLINQLFGNGQPISKEEWKYVEGAADKAARNHINNLVALAQAGDWAGANGLNQIVKKLYGIDFGPRLNGQEFEKKDAARKKVHMNELQQAATEAINTLMRRLEARIVDEKEEAYFGALPGFILGATKEGLLATGIATYRDLFVDSATFLGGKVDDPDFLRNNPNITEAELADLILPIEGKDRPRVSITQNAHAEVLAFFKHVDWVQLNDRGFQAGPKPPASGLLGDRWTMKDIEAKLRWKNAQTANSLMAMIRPTTPRPGQQATPPPSARDMIRMLQGGLVKRADGGGYESVPPEISPLRDSLDLGQSDFTPEALDEILASTDRSTKAKGNTTLAKIEVIPDRGDKQENGVYFQLEYDFANGQAGIDEDDFEVVIETVSGQDKERVRIFSKWGKTRDNGDMVPKFETVAEADEADTIEELRDLAFSRMRHKLIAQSTANINSATGRQQTRSSNPVDPREVKYFQRPFEWTGRLILSGDGVDTGRPSAEFSDPEIRPKTRQGRLSDGPYLVDALQTIARLNLRGIAKPSRGVGLKRITGREELNLRGYDGFVFDVGGDRARATEVIRNVANAMRKLAKERKGDTVIQTSYTAKGQEDDSVLILPDFKDPDSDISQGQINEAKQLYGTIPPGWAESMHLQYVTVTRPKRKISFGPRFWMAHFAETKKRKATADLIRDGIKRGLLPPDFDMEAQLDVAKLPKKYGIIEAAALRVPPMMDAAFDAEIENAFNALGDPLEKSDDDLRAYMDGIGMPKAATEAFIKRRQEVMDEFDDVQGQSQEQLRIGAVAIMRSRTRAKVSGATFDPNAWVVEGPEEADDNVELDDEGNPIIPDGPDADDLLDEGQEKMISGGDAGIDPDDDDEDEEDIDTDGGPAGYGLPGGSFSSGAVLDDGEEGTGAAGRASRTRSTPSGRFGRRLTRFENRSGLQQALNAMELAGIRTDVRLDPLDRMRATDFAMRFWDGFNQTGIALDLPTDRDVVGRRQSTIIGLLPEVGKRMRARRNPDGSSVVKIGKTTDNAGLENPSGATWMLSVQKLLDTIRIPTRWLRQEDQTRGDIVQETLEDGTEGDRRVARVGMYWRQSSPLSISNLRELLGLNVVEEKKLREPNAGLSHDTVRYLLAEIGKQPEFSDWRLFTPVTNDEAKERGMTPIERLEENVGRATMRDRFIIETFGADAYPYWHDRGIFVGNRGYEIAEEELTIRPGESELVREASENIEQFAEEPTITPSGRMITAEQYRDLEETDSVRRFNALGKFENSPNYMDDSEAEAELAYEGIEGATLDDVSVDVAISAPRKRGSRVAKRDLRLELLLDYLGIPNEKGWEEKLKPILQSAFGVGDKEIGLGKDAVKSWANEGVPVAYVQEMIRTNVIPNAKAVWEVNKVGQKLDEELVAAKPQVYEALTEFIDRSFPDSAVNTSETRSYIINSREMPTVLRNAAERRGSSFAKGTGDVPRFSRDELQEFVNRFNERFGTNHTIEDIFSHEQLRNAERRLREGQTMFQKSKPGRKGTRKVSPTVANS